METAAAVEDIYRKINILFLRKGQVPTDEFLLKLQQFDIAEKFDSRISNDFVNHQIVQRCTKNIKAGFCNLERAVTNNAYEIVCDILLKLQKSSLNIYINALNNYIDWVYVHSVNVALISTIIASQLNYSQQEQINICTGALFHDIGKLLVPKKIIQKPGPLTSKEKCIVKQHCQIGYDIMANTEFPDYCIEIALQHHERLDGSGYPHQLVKSQISEYAKIVMVADVLEAITSYRPYKRVNKMEYAIHELNNRANEYDQNIVRVLF